MGPQESAAVETARPFSSEMYLPMGGMRMSSEKDKDGSNFVQFQFHKPRSHIVKTSFAGVWSMISIENSPTGRTGQFTCYDESKHFLYSGFGVSHSDQYLSDINILDISTRTWHPFPLKGPPIPPRVNSRAIIFNDTLFIFGGSYDRDYFNDLYAISLSDGSVTPLKTHGSIPSPRSSPILGAYNRCLYLWGGYDGLGCPTELYILNLDSLEWESSPQDATGRAAAAYVQVGNLVYGYGASKVGGLLVLNLESRTVTHEPTTGAEPPPLLVGASMVYVDGFILVIGGKAQSDFTFLYACSLQKKWWYVFHALPDSNTVSIADGSVSDLGMFMLPRVHSLGAVYDPESRQVIGIFGSSIKEPPPLMQLDIADSLSYIHLRDDMVCALQNSIRLPGV